MREQPGYDQKQPQPGQDYERYQQSALQPRAALQSDHYVTCAGERKTGQAWHHT
jgi:hypothetical protein